ncbi:hypothetical protein B1C78_03210 [Thioalkalivibrio denitrificans]|uniref:Uncharacterized protein n=1 Tax=Thioalkalivibrio denitrificans TaxID=108003 RepID=A0A1V3NRT2_9GAMM|nr:hypothetical protein [Thioalkalivibrio denitrificans]OOG27673.1 hypothetical protein B1C78_03210 [Thioalkalivibrio denitrificans]
MSDYRRAARELDKHARELDRLMDRLEAAREASDAPRVAETRRKVIDAERATAAAYDAMAAAVRAHWRERAGETLRELIAVATPLAARYRAERRAAGDLIPWWPPIFEALGNAPEPELDGDVPSEPPECGALDRTEERLW